MAMSDPKTEERRERFRDYCRSRGWWTAESGRWSITNISDATGKPKQKVSDLLNGHGAFGAKIAREIERALHVPEGYFDGLTSEDDFALVPRAHVQVSAGHGALVYEEGRLGALSFRRSFLQEIGVSPASAVVVTVKGRSMEPTIPDGSVLLVSRSSKHIIDREIYAYRRDGELYVKRLVKRGTGIVALSDNPDKEMYPDSELDESITDLEILGRALWMGARL